MHVQVVNKGIDVSAALSERVTARIEDAVSKHFGGEGEAFVVVTKDGFRFKAECALHLPSGAHLHASGSADDAYAAVDDAAARLEKRLRRYKTRLKDRRTSRAAPPEPASFVVLQSTGADLEEDEDARSDAPSAAAPSASADEPLIIAETTGELPILSVGMAVQEMGLTDAPALIFKNAANGALNVVYRRPDGHIGWIDPSRPARAEAS